MKPLLPNRDKSLRIDKDRANGDTRLQRSNCARAEERNLLLKQAIKRGARVVSSPRSLPFARGSYGSLTVGRSGPGSFRQDITGYGHPRLEQIAIVSLVVCCDAYW